MKINVLVDFLYPNFNLCIWWEPPFKICWGLENRSFYSISSKLVTSFYLKENKEPTNHSTDSQKSLILSIHRGSVGILN